MINSIIKKIKTLPAKFNDSEILSDIFELGALSLSNQCDFREPFHSEREERYKQIKSKYESDFNKLVEIFGLICDLIIAQTEKRAKFNDWLGELYMQSLTQSEKAGQFFTPYCVCRAMAENVDIKTENKILTMLEPAVGSGAIIISMVDALQEKGINYTTSFFVECGDIDKRCVFMTYIQLSLLGVPAVVYHRDGLSLETWDCFHTPALCMQWLKFKDYVK